MLKSKLLAIIAHHQTENFNISYKNASIGGFPFSWKVTLLSPKLTVITQDISQEFITDSLICDFSYNFSKAKLNFGNIFHYTTEDGEGIRDYQLKSENNVVITVNLFENFYRIDQSDSLKKLVKNIEFGSPSILGSTSKGEELFSLSDMRLLIEQKIDSSNAEILSLKLSGDYKSLIQENKLNNIVINFDGTYTTNELETENNLGFERRIEISSAKINLNQAYCNLKGLLSLARNQAPLGKISIELMNYEEFIDSLVPNDFIFSSNYLKKIIAKIISKDLSAEQTEKVSKEKVNFDVNFSDDGVTLGNLNIVDLQRN